MKSLPGASRLKSYGSGSWNYEAEFEGTSGADVLDRFFVAGLVASFFCTVADDVTDFFAGAVFCSDFFVDSLNLARRALCAAAIFSLAAALRVRRFDGFVNCAG